MKKVVALLLILTMGVNLCACGSSNKKAFEGAEKRFLSAIELTDHKPADEALIYKIIQ